MSRPNIYDINTYRKFYKTNGSGNGITTCDLGGLFMTKIIMETSVANEVPILSVFQEELYNCPLVFFVHGYGADREQAID